MVYELVAPPSVTLEEVAESVTPAVSLSMAVAVPVAIEMPAYLASVLDAVCDMVEVTFPSSIESLTAVTVTAWGVE